MKTKLLLLITLFISFNAFSQAPSTSYEAKIFSTSNDRYDHPLGRGDLNILFVTHVYDNSMGGFGPIKKLRGYRITVRVRNMHYNKRFKVNGTFASATYTKDEEPYDVFDLYVSSRRLRDDFKIEFISDYKTRMQTIGNSKRYTGFTYKVDIKTDN